MNSFNRIEYTDCLVCGGPIADGLSVMIPNGGVEHCPKCWKRCCSQNPSHKYCPRRSADPRIH